MLGDPSGAQAPGGFTVNAASAVNINTSTLTSARTGKLVLSGTGGGVGTRYAVVSGTNLNPPVVWTPIVPNAFDGSGNFHYTNNVNPTTPSLFLRMQQ